MSASKGWLAMQETTSRTFTDEQRRWLEDIRDQIAGSVSIGDGRTSNSPHFHSRAGSARRYQLFGEELGSLLDELNTALVV